MRYVYFVRGAKYANLALTSIASVLKADPFGHAVIITDDPTVDPDPTLRVIVMRLPLPAPMMLANIEAQIGALHAFHDERLVFLDVDTLMLEPLPINPGSDLVVTWRDKVGVDEDGKPVQGIAATMPYNFGVIGVQANLATLEAFIWMRERVRVMSPQLQRWYGNQVALASLCGARPETVEPKTESRSIPWTPTQSGKRIVIEKLPCERWNYTPEKVGERVHGTRSILHFKGNRLHLMESYAKRLGLNWYSEEKVA